MTLNSILLIIILFPGPKDKEVDCSQIEEVILNNARNFLNHENTKLYITYGKADDLFHKLAYGNIKEVKTYTLDPNSGKKIPYSSYKYSTNNKLLQYTNTCNFGASGKVIFKYDSVGNRIFEDTPHETRTYKYDKNHNISQVIVDSKTSSSNRYQRFEYSCDSLTQVYDAFNPEGKQTLHSLRVFNQKGLVMIEESGQPLSKIDSYTYNNSDFLVEILSEFIFNGPRYSYVKFEYNECGLMVKHEFTNTKGEINLTKHFEYKIYEVKSGRLIIEQKITWLRKQKSTIEFHTYTLDRRGNWINHVISREDEYHMEYLRKIKYY